jgi:hypothetical protein
MQSRPANLVLIFLISNLCTLSAFMVITQSIVRAEQTYKFRCNERMNSKGKVIPITEMLFPNQKILPLIRWESDFNANPKAMCDKVSTRFNYLSIHGNLHFLKFTTDKRTEKTIICGLSLKNKDRPCDESNKLFEMSKMKGDSRIIKDPKQILSGLKNNMVTIDVDGGIFQNSDDEYTQIVDLEASIEQQSANR